MEGYKGFYKTDNDLIVRDYFSRNRTLGKEYILDDDRELMYGSEVGHGFHFSDSISKTMPFFRVAISNNEFALTRIETIGDVIESRRDEGCYVTRGYKINKIFKHEEIVDEIEKNIADMESVHIVGHYTSLMSNEEKQRILNAYCKLYEKLQDNFDVKWHEIYCLYEAVIILQSSLKSECWYSEFDKYTNASDKKDYTKKIILKM